MAASGINKEGKKLIANISLLIKQKQSDLFLKLPEQEAVSFPVLSVELLKMLLVFFLQLFRCVHACSSIFFYKLKLNVDVFWWICSALCPYSVFSSFEL